MLQTGAVSLVEEESSKRKEASCFCNHQQKRCKWTTVIMTPDHVEVEILKVLEQMEMTSAFTDVLHVANLTTGSHLMSILKQSDAFSKEDCAKLASKLSGRKASIGVKKLLGLIDMVKQTDPR